MKKIRFAHEKDRIVCVTGYGQHDFYYQPYKSKARYWLFELPFSPSIFRYFRTSGRNMNDRGFSLTIRELYNFRKWEYVKLSHLMDMLPGHVDYVIQEYILDAYGDKKSTIPVRINHHTCELSYDYELAG